MQQAGLTYFELLGVSAGEVGGLVPGLIGSRIKMVIKCQNQHMWILTAFKLNYVSLYYFVILCKGLHQLTCFSRNKEMEYAEFAHLLHPGNLDADQDLVGMFQPSSYI